MDLTSNHEIDVSKASKSILKEWKIVCGCIGAGGFLSLLHIFNSTPVYQSVFKIVLDKGRDNALPALLSESGDLTSLLGIVKTSRGDSINNEIAILNSPSVLMPVFEYYKEAAGLNSKGTSSIQFENWVSSVVIEKEKGTSVLDVRFNTTYKELAVPVANLISKTYQEYSNRGRQRELSNLSEYLMDQINQTKKRAVLSSRKSLEYGYNNGLSLLDGLPIVSTVKRENGDSSAGQSNIEIVRTGILQKIRSLNIQIEDAKKLAIAPYTMHQNYLILTNQQFTKS